MTRPAAGSTEIVHASSARLYGSTDSLDWLLVQGPAEHRFPPFVGRCRLLGEPLAVLGQVIRTEGPAGMALRGVAERLGMTEVRLSRIMHGSSPLRLDAAQWATVVRLYLGAQR